jgi:hypothetical protein
VAILAHDSETRPPRRRPSVCTSGGMADDPFARTREPPKGATPAEHPVETNTVQSPWCECQRTRKSYVDGHELESPCKYGE